MNKEKVIIRQIFTVQDLIDELKKVSNKSLPIYFSGEDGKEEIDLAVKNNEVLIF